MYSDKCFGEAIDELLREQHSWPWRPSVQRLAQELDISPSTLRSAMYGRTKPPKWMVERVAEHFKKDPEYFREYRAEMVAIAIDRHPEVGREFFDALLKRLRPEEVDALREDMS